MSPRAVTGRTRRRDGRSTPTESAKGTREQHPPRRRGDVPLGTCKGTEEPALAAPTRGAPLKVPGNAAPTPTASFEAP